MKYGIDNLKKCVDLGIELEKVSAELIKNGKNFLADMPVMFAELPVLIADVQTILANHEQLLPEAKDLDAEESDELITYVATKLTLENAKAEKIVIASLDLVIALALKGVALSAAIKG